MMGLTERQHVLLTYLRTYHTEHGVMPLYREMQQALGLSSKSAVNRLLGHLVWRGAIRQRKNCIRGIEIVAHECPRCGHDLNSSLLAPNAPPAQAGNGPGSTRVAFGAAGDTHGARR